ncbi:MAG: DNA/RNA non-specific endonuclease [Desulfobacterales bacterium]|nr:DNA/RNA non-specific endonuclease [Desulfobacterales bacterium]
MPKVTAFVVLMLTCICNYTNATSHRHAYGGIPSDGAYMERNAYIIQFDPVRKTPRWVAYHIKPSYLNAPEPTDLYRDEKWKTHRNDPTFRNEATRSDYRDQFHTWRNYAKGHLVPYYISGGDRDNDGRYATDGDSYDARTVHEIMYMTNMAPQHHFNFDGPAGLWHKLETYVRDRLVKERQQEVWVFAGCIYGPREYDVIGGDVEVPPMFFKLVITETEGNPEILAFLFPHQSTTHGDIQDYLVSVNIIEAMTGLDFFPDLHNIDWEEKERTSTWENWK